MHKSCLLLRNDRWRRRLSQITGRRQYVMLTAAGLNPSRRRRRRLANDTIETINQSLDRGLVPWEAITLWTSAVWRSLSKWKSNLNGRPRAVGERHLAGNEFDLRPSSNAKLYVDRIRQTDLESVNFFRTCSTNRSKKAG